MHSNKTTKENVMGTLGLIKDEDLILFVVPFLHLLFIKLKHEVTPSS